MITTILIIIASICNAIMDIIRFRFNESIFRNLNPNYFNPNVSYLNQNNIWYKVLKQAPDLWHNAKSLMIICICVAISIEGKLLFESVWLNIIYLGIVWNIVFNVFYNIILRKTK